MTGFLKKKDVGSLIAKRRWFTLQESRLCYYVQEQEKFSFAKGNPPEGFYSLHYALAIETSGTKTIKVQYPEQTIELIANDTAARNSWLKALKNAADFYHRLEDYTGVMKNTFGFTRDDMEREGVMEKKGTLQSWKEVYLILRDGMLFIFDKKGGSRKGRIPLYDCTLEPIPTTADRFAFELASPDSGKKVILSCLDEIECQIWLNSILKQKLMIEESINLISF